MATVFFPGTFRPFTLGHADIVSRALEIFDRVVIAIGHNIEKNGDKDEIDRRLEAIRSVYATDPRVSVIVYSGLTVDAARRAGATAMVRGVRSVKDFEYERTLADVNRRISGMETVLLPASAEYEWLSSTVLRDLEANGRDITPYLPAPVSKAD